MKLIPLPAFQDSDLWVLHDGSRALVADPGDAHPVLACLQRDRLQLGAILVTHHDGDHDARPPAPCRPQTTCVRQPTAASRGAARMCRMHESAPGNPLVTRRREPAAGILIHSLQRCEELRARDLPTLPSAEGEEPPINPFLRARLPVVQAVRAHDAATPPDAESGFATLRQWKNEFK